MDEKAHEIQCSHEELRGLDQRDGGNWRYLIDKSVVETVMVDTEEAPLHSEENKDFDPTNCELGSNKMMVEGISRVVGESEEASCRVEPETSKILSNSAAGVASETMVPISPAGTPFVSGGHRANDAKAFNLEPSKLSLDQSMTKVSEAGKHSCVIDVNSGSCNVSGDKREGERVCRICHLSSDQSPDRRKAINVSNASTDLIHLGCGCKDDLGTAHAHCAEAWFKLKGNRLCEICGEIAANINDTGDSRFMEEWNERGSTVGSTSADRNGRCWQGQPFCNFMMAFLVIIFVLPWFFRVNIFS